MKTCPVCGARCFDDMDVCYGCMHRFGPGGSAVAPQAATVFGQAANPAAYQSAPSAPPAQSASNVVVFPGQGAPVAQPAVPETAGSTPSPVRPSACEGALEGGAPSLGAPAPCAPASAPQAIAAPEATCGPSPDGSVVPLEGVRCEEAPSSAPGASCSAAFEARQEPQALLASEGGASRALEGTPPAGGAAAALAATVVSQPISFGELAQGMKFQLVVTLRPCPPASTGEGA